MVKQLSTILCQVASVEAAAAFYRDVLKLTPTFVSPGWGQFDLPGGGSIGLHPPFGDGQKANGSGWILGIEVESLNDLKNALIRCGHWTGPYHDVPGGVVLDFTDVDGNPIQAIQTGITKAALD
ncbi:MAG: VOC family protein [Fimbriimonas sp.]|nr:VOC family protein [Fimbriimonas sp.]